MNKFLRDLLASTTKKDGKNCLKKTLLFVDANKLSKKLKKQGNKFIIQLI